jgi:hypothetical protein
MSWLNWIGNRLIFAPLVSLATHHWLSDSLCGYKAFPTTMFQGKNRLIEDSWNDFEMLIKAARQKARIAEVPIKYTARKHGKTKMRPLQDGWNMLKLLFKLWRQK